METHPQRMMLLIDFLRQNQTPQEVVVWFGCGHEKKKKKRFKGYNTYLSYASFNRCFYHQVGLAFSHQFHSYGELLDIVNEMNDIRCIFHCSEFFEFQLYEMIDIQWRNS